MDERTCPFTIYTLSFSFEMLDWLRPLFLMFYSPARGMSEARDRAQLGPAALLAFLGHVGYAFYTELPYLVSQFGIRRTIILTVVITSSATSLISTALIFVPASIVFARLFDRRGSVTLTLRQEFAPVACTVFYALAASDLAALPFAFLLKSSGWLARISQWCLDYLINAQHARVPILQA